MKILKIQNIIKCIIILIYTQNIYAQDENSSSYNLDLKLNYNITPQIKISSFDSVINAMSGGASLYVDRETATSWNNISPIAKLRFNYENNDWLEFNSEIYFRKDIEAWFNSDNGNNLFINSREFDINLPIISKLIIKKDNLKFQIGRFPFSFNQNSNRSVIISGSPYDDAISFNYSQNNFTFDYYVTTLNPWLHGNGIKNYSSEHFRQNNILLYQQRDKVFNENYKTLVAHRISYSNNNLSFALSELSMIGGIKPNLSDINPFTIWHNDFNEYNNSLFAFDGEFKNGNSKIYGELAIDDIISGINESSADSKNIFAYLVGINYQSKINYWKMNLSIEAISVNPYFGNHDIPLSKLISRRIYYSNYRKRGSPNYSDIYFVDYPIGYYRGPDAKDLWLDLNIEKNNIKISNQFGWLRNGNITIGHAHKGDDDKAGTDYLLILPIKSRNELRNIFNISYFFKDNLNLDFGIILRKINSTNLYFTFGINYNLSVLSSSD